MFDNKTFLAIIPARGGSKGIPKKNISLLGGKPLISHSIKAALDSKYLDRIVVSTDDEEISGISKQYGAEILNRPHFLAGDKTTSIDVILHALSAIDEKYDAVVLLQPTSPLRLATHINEAIELYVSHNCKSLVSVSICETPPLLIRNISIEGSLTPLLQKRSDIQRQDMENYYAVNGAIYINKIDQLNGCSSLNDNEIGYIMHPKYSVDIDEPLDLTIAEAVYSTL